MRQRTLNSLLVVSLLLTLLYIVFIGAQNMRKVYSTREKAGSTRGIMQGEFLMWEGMGSTVLSRGF